MIARILVATDFSPRSDRALRRGILLARQNSTELLLTHVIDDDQPQRLIDVEKREAAALLHELASTLRESDGIDCESHVAIGDAFQGIVRMAEETSVDLLILNRTEGRCCVMFSSAPRQSVSFAQVVYLYYWPMVFRPAPTAKCS